jgi:hypothetical protein
MRRAFNTFKNQRNKTIKYFTKELKDSLEIGRQVKRYKYLISFQIFQINYNFILKNLFSKLINEEEKNIKSIKTFIIDFTIEEF